LVVLTYQNPVWPGYFADPFVLRFEGQYYAYGTGAAPLESDGRAFPMLRSDDLVNWRYVGGAVAAVAGATAYWAPEVAERNGTFYLYYSAAFGNSDESHGLRVAIANSPTGPFRDQGKLLLPRQGFSIDPHPFRDPRTGKWYLYFATDYTHDEPYGTGLAVVPLHDDLVTVTGEPMPVVRASQDWHIYERNRDYKNRVWNAWNTVEGPFVVYHDDRYWCMYSGGRWSGDDYGVGVAVAEHPLGPWRDESAIDGPVVLKGGGEGVIGPGHNSVTTAPDDQTLVCVYHAWNSERTLRRMCIDPLIFTPQGPRCIGPSVGPQTIARQM
jgi:beta-xylosidase